jgi:hypothetical protein
MDDLGTHVTQEHGCSRANQLLCEIQDEDIG